MLECHTDIHSGEQQLLFIQRLDVMWAVTNSPLHLPPSFQVVLSMHMYM